jgi:hypothetical protein
LNRKQAGEFSKLVSLCNS